MLFNGANVAEKINISANGGRVLFSRDIANVTMDLDDVETIDFNALGGADNIIVNDLTGTDVKKVNIDLAGDRRRWRRRRPTPSSSTAPTATTSSRCRSQNGKLVVNGLATPGRDRELRAGQRHASSSTASPATT